MCGLVGMAGRIETIHKSIFRDMLTVCQTRGRDSTGVISIKNNNDVDYVKMVGTPEILLDSKRYEKQCEAGNVKVLIGHTRAKTLGAVSQRNAHPFEFDDVIGVHNGTLKGEYSMEGRRDFEVDSEWLYWFIDRYGIENALPQIDEDGAWALTYWNKRDNTLNMIRNEHRPLWITYDKECKVMFWASEPWFFSTVSRRIDLWDGGDTKKVYFSLDEDRLLSMAVDNTYILPSKIFTMKPLQEIKGKEVRRYTGNLGWKQGQNQYQHLGSTGPSSNVSNGGGEVADPFQAGRETVQRLMKGELDDSVPTLGSPPLLTPPESSKTPSESTTSSTPKTPLVESSQTTSGSTTASKNLTNGALLKESLASRKSKLLQQAANASTTSDSNIICGNFRKANFNDQKVTLRQVSGIDFIQDHKTKREFSEQGFDTATGGSHCMFCKKPIGSLNEVDEIFVEPVPAKNEVTASFICTTCTSGPAVAVH